MNEIRFLLERISNAKFVHYNEPMTLETAREFANRALSLLPTSGWIPVTERLPEEYAAVWARKEKEFYCAFWTKDDGWYLTLPSARLAPIRLIGITHFMPIPPLPADEPCETCGGSGHKRFENPPSVNRETGKPHTYPCPDCKGIGRQPSEKEESGVKESAKEALDILLKWLMDEERVSVAEMHKVKKCIDRQSARIEELEAKLTKRGEAMRYMRDFYSRRKDVDCVLLQTLGPDFEEIIKEK